jgi:predicted transcriptional regulator
MNKSRKSKKIGRLGDLEAEVMGVVWEKDRVSVQEVRDALRSSHALAYTTVMTVMSRLAEKGLLEREKEGRAYIYTPAATQDKVARSLLQSLVRKMYDGAAGKAIAQLLEEDGNVDEAELERLEQMIRAKRERSRS